MELLSNPYSGNSKAQGLSRRPLHYTMLFQKTNLVDSENLKEERKRNRVQEQGLSRGVMVMESKSNKKTKRSRKGLHLT